MERDRKPGQNGKGDTARRNADYKKYLANYDRIFGKKKKKAK